MASNNLQIISGHSLRQPATTQRGTVCQRKSSQSVPSNDDHSTQPNLEQTMRCHERDSVRHSRKMSTHWTTAHTHYRINSPVAPPNSGFPSTKTPIDRINSTDPPPNPQHSLTHKHRTHRRHIDDPDRQLPSKHRQSAPSTTTSPYARKRPEAPSREAYNT